mmetsp:Transcript_3115/g.6865  ORF Transcript_3115/g.6865 Transcript_3115/m.6865 type:complete len:754 (+) Transcript_3115:1916-4177(+)
MLSVKLCLPRRYTEQLAKLVLRKTRGNPMFVIEFLRTIIQRNMMTFSIKARRWVWDDTSIDLQLISDSVAEFLTKKLKQLDTDVIVALKVAACIGVQVNTSIIQLLDLGQFVPNLLQAFESAVKEGVMEEAGNLYVFTHDMLKESSYNLMSIDERNCLHKMIATSLAQDPAVVKYSKRCILVVDQINVCKDVHGILDPIERTLFARLNLAAGKHSIASSSFEHARRYFEAGISLLHANHWIKQYSLSLKLYEMSAVVCFMDGNVEAVLSRLQTILSHTKTFDDAWNSRILQAKLLASQERYAEGVMGVLEILSQLGEEFPKVVELSVVVNEIKATQYLLNGITKEKILALPAMKDKTKLNAMVLMDLLIVFCNFWSPKLMYLVICRMIKLTFHSGYCEESISALVHMTHGLVMHTDDIQSASRVNRIADSLIQGHPNEHHLRSRLTWIGTSAKVFVQPFQAVAECYMKGYNSAIIVGDIDSAMLNVYIYCIASFFFLPDLIGLQQSLIKYMHQMDKHRRINVLRSLMSCFNATIALIGNGDLCSLDDTKIEMKSNEDLYEIADQTQNTYLMHNLIMAEIYVHCYFRDHISSIKLVERCRVTSSSKRLMDFYCVFFEGISALSLARDTRQEKWKIIGERTINTISKMAEYSNWNFENKLRLLQAEYHYVNGRNAMAELSYQASIISAREHRFINEEALACELYGMFLVENKDIQKGVPQLQNALERYTQWGALKKATDVKEFIELVEKSRKYFW